MKAKNVLLAVATVGAAVTGGVLLKNGKSAKSISKVVTPKAVSEVEKTFAGLTQSEIDKIAENTYRGIKAVINGDSLEYFYKSNSGRSKNMARLVTDSAGKVTTFLGSGPYFYAGSPRAFTEKIIEAINNKH